MKPINLTTLFTTPLNNIAQTRQIGFSGNELRAFPSELTSGVQDSYTTNPLLGRVTNIGNLMMAMQSGEVQNLLKENGLPQKLNTNALGAISNHSQGTRILAAKIASNMN